MSEAHLFEKVDIGCAIGIMEEHAANLSSPWDSYMEEHLLSNEAFLICNEKLAIGYASVNKDTLFSFYVTKPHYAQAPHILESFIEQRGITNVCARTNDPLFMALLMEWDYEVGDRDACFFTDGGRIKKPEVKADKPVFREAVSGDAGMILAHTGDFFDKLDERIAHRTIFVLMDGSELMGCGIVEKGIVQKQYVSIGMITCREHRQKGVAQTILWHLKEWAYEMGLQPIAGCWYYNVLSRKSLERSGMVASGKAFTVRPLKKDALPLRTGNPPGEPV